MASWAVTLAALRSTAVRSAAVPVLALLMLGTAPSAARAQTAADEQARALFGAGRTAYEAGNFEDALRYFEESYQLSQRAPLLFNIAQAADRLDRDARALEAYRAYAAQVPDAPNLELVRGRIRLLEASTGGRATGEALAPWLIVGIGVALMGAGVPMVVVAGEDANAVNTAPDGSVWADYAGAADGAVPISIAGQVLTYVGAAAIAGGLAWGIAELAGGGGGEAVAVRVGPGSIALRGRFE
jgi:tetratricopeptide (TPR) repeat protein